MFELYPSSPKTALPGTVSMPSPVEEPTGSLNALKSFFNVLYRRRRAVLGIFVGFFALVLIGTLVTPKRYTTDVKFIAGNPGGPVSQSGSEANSSLPVLNALLIAGGAQSGETYAELFQETPVAQQVAADLHLSTSPGALLSHITVKPITNTSLLTLSATWSDPAGSAAIANDFANVIMDRQRALVASQATQAITFLGRELPSAQKRMRDTSTALAAYEAEHHLTDIGGQTQTVIANSALLSSKIDQATIDASQASAQLAAIRAQMGHTPATIQGDSNVTINPAYSTLEGQLAQNEVQLATARKQYTDQHPAVIALLDQQRELRSQLASTARTVQASTNTIPNPQYQQLAQQAGQLSSQQAAIAAQLGSLTAQRRALAPELSRLPDNIARLADLQRQAKSAQDVVSALQQKYDDASVAKTSALSDVTVTQPATGASASVSPNLRNNVLLGLLLGIVLAIGGTLILDYFDDSIKNEADAEARLALPYLGNVPDVKKRNGITTPWVQSLAIESFLQLVTALK